MFFSPWKTLSSVRNKTIHSLSFHRQKEKKWGNTFASLHQVHVSFTIVPRFLSIYLYIFLVCRKSVSGHLKHESRPQDSKQKKSLLIPSIRLSIHFCAFPLHPSAVFLPSSKGTQQPSGNRGAIQSQSDLRKENNKIPATHLWFPP